MNFILGSIEPLIEKIEKLSKVHRILICVGTFSILIGFFILLSYLPKSGQIGALTQEFESLQFQLETAKRNAGNLEKFKNLMKTRNAEFDQQMKALPDQNEIPKLLAGISQAGKEAGLEFLLFQPKPDEIKEFYAEIPVSITVEGSYHSVALFFDKVARMPRIVNIRNIDMVSSKNSAKLVTSCTAVTYKFVEAPPQKGKTEAKPKGGK
ncbi:MAG: type 4a pilus biogenesis protein PilO [Desulfobacterales bacterium]|nr:type 4a pilus biogenesis protein PilO [Desulfobacterales bacterium]